MLHAQAERRAEEARLSESRERTQDRLRSLANSLAMTYGNNQEEEFERYLIDYNVPPEERDNYRGARREALDAMNAALYQPDGGSLDAMSGGSYKKRNSRRKSKRGKSKRGKYKRRKSKRDKSKRNKSKKIKGNY